MPWTLPPRGHYLVGQTADQSVVVCVGDSSSTWAQVGDYARAAGVQVDAGKWTAYTDRDTALAKARRVTGAGSVDMKIVHVATAEVA